MHALIGRHGRWRCSSNMGGVSPGGTAEWHPVEFPTRRSWPSTEGENNKKNTQLNIFGLLFRGHKHEVFEVWQDLDALGWVDLFLRKKSCCFF